MRIQDQERLRRYVARITRAQGGLEALPDQPFSPTPATAGPEAATIERGGDGRKAVADRGFAAAVQRAAEKLARGGETLSPQEYAATEAIIIPDRRPAFDIVGGRFSVTHPLWRWLTDTPDVHARLLAAIPRIGRIELPGQARIPYGGTGFIVGCGLLMTNRHVAEIFARGLGERNIRFRTDMRAALDLQRERDQPDGPLLEVRRVRMIHPWWDMALLEVDGLPTGLDPLVLSALDARELDGRQVAVIGYPAYDPLRNDPEVQDVIFDRAYGVKRLQPGEIDAPRQTESFGKLVAAAAHDCSTLGGNSGSAVIDLETGEVLGLHFGGRYLDVNFAVPAAELARDARVRAAGVTFAGAVSGGPPPEWLRTWDAIEGSVTDQANSNPPRDAPSTSAPAPQPPSAPGGRVTFEVPLRITIELGGGAPAVVEGFAAAAPDTTERMIEPAHDTDYRDRRGYDPGFLPGVAVPLPQPRDPRVLAPRKDGGTMLDYENFSVLMHAERRLALVTASNVSLEPRLRRPEPGRDYTRKGLGGLGPNDSEKWFIDDRLDPRYQLPDRFFTRDDGAFDKGHLVRREDVAHGVSYAAIRRANGDTFHVTNCSPQVARFNQSARGEDNWGDVENLVLAQAAQERFCIFAGPVLDPEDQRFPGRAAGGQTLWARIPARFWKVVVSRTAAGIAAHGFVLKQDLTDVPLEFAVMENFRRLQVPLAAIEAATGLDFGAVLRSADAFDGDEAVEMARRGGLVRTESLLAESHARPTANFGDSGPRPKVAAGTLAAAAAVPTTAAPDGLAPLLDALRQEQALATPRAGPPVRFVAAFEGSPPDDAVVADDATARLGLPVLATALFDPDPALDRFRLLRLEGIARPDRADLFEMASALRSAIGAVAVEPDLGTDYFQGDAPPPDTAAPESADAAFWCWADPVADRPSDPDWALVRSAVREAWALSEETGRPARGAGILVFQPDTGVVPGHGELPPGIAADPRAANFVGDSPDPVDPMTGGGNPGHGTGTGSVVASPLGGRMAGAAPSATLIPIRCIETVAVFDQSGVAQAVDHARRHGAHVITMSLGGVPSLALHAALRRAVADNVIVLAAAGNCVEEVVWPARYAEAIAVGGVNEALRPWRGSSHGPAVAISGPAEFVLRADAHDPAEPLAAVGGGQGTSFATALIAGVAALWLAHHGRDTLIAGLPPGGRLQDLFRTMLRETAQVPGGFDTGEYGAGVVDARRLLATTPSLAASPAAAAEPAVEIEGLLGRVFGAAGLEAAGPLLHADPQHAAELVCAAFDRTRRAGTRRAYLESRPPTQLSPTLRRRLGSAVAQLS